MNIYEPTGKKIENWPQMVGRLSEENLELKRKIRAIPLSVQKLPRCDLKKLGPPPLKLDQETLERIRRDGALANRKSRSKRSRKRSS